MKSKKKKRPQALLTSRLMGTGSVSSKSCSLHKLPKALLTNRLYVHDDDIDEEIHLPPFKYKYKERVYDEMFGESVIVESEHASYKHNEKKQMYGFHRGNLAKIRRVFKGFEIVDRRVAPKLGFKLKRRFKPRAEQKSVTAEWLQNGYGVIKAPVRWGKCVSGSTLVPTERGVFRIDELVPSVLRGKELLSEVSTKVVADEYSALANFGYSKKIDGTLKVITDWGYSVECTPEHPLLVLGKLGPEWKSAEDITVGSYIALRSFPLLGTPVSLAPISEKLKNSIKPSYTQKIRLPNRMTSQIAKLFGYLIGDGNVSIQRLVGFVNLNKSNINKVIDALRKLGIRASVKIGKTKSGNKIYTVLSHSVELDEFLEWCGVNKVTARKKEIPWSIRASGEEIIKSFLSAYFECDGHAGKNGVVEATSGSYTLLQQVQTLLLGFGVVSSLQEITLKYKGKWRSYWRIKVDPHFVELFKSKVGFQSARKKEMLKVSSRGKSGKTAKYTVPINDLMCKLWDKIHRQYSYGRSGSSRLGERRRRFEWYLDHSQRSLPTVTTIREFLQEFKEEGSAHPEYQALQAVSQPGTWWVPVSSVHKSARQPVYDLTVPGSHWFLANGIVSHNTFAVMYLATKLQTRTLILSDKIHLCHQWLKHFRKMTNVNKMEKKLGVKLIGVFHKKESEFFPITISTFQTLWARQRKNKFLTKNKSYFGFVSADETHHVPADTYGAVTAAFNAKYRCGVTATDKRRDQKHHLLYDIVGPVTGVGRTEQLPCEVVKHQTDIHIDPKASWGWMTTLITKSNDLNEMVANQVVKDVAGGRYVLVHTERKAHCHELKDLIQDLDPSVKVGIAHGGVPIKERDQLIKDMNSKRIHVIIGAKVIQEGLTFERPDVIHIGYSPTTNPDTWEQITGRVRTPMESKPKPIIHDWRLKGHGGVYASGKARDKLYHKMKWSVAEDMSIGFGSGDAGKPPVPRFCGNCLNFFDCKADEVHPKDEPCSSDSLKWTPIRLSPRGKLHLITAHKDKLRGQFSTEFVESLGSQNYSFWSRKQLGILQRIYEEVLDHPRLWLTQKLFSKYGKTDD